MSGVSASGAETAGETDDSGLPLGDPIPAPPGPDEAAAPTVHVTGDERQLVITVDGVLDADAATLICETATVAIRAAVPPGKVEIDLRAMDDWTSAGLRGLSECAGLGVRLRMGPHCATPRALTTD